MTLCTFNIRYRTWRDGCNRWSRRRNQVFELWRRHNWDVVGVQEALPSQLADLRQALAHYGAVGVGRDNGAAKGEHCPIFYHRDRFTVAQSGTFWLSETPAEPGTKSWGAAYPRICTWAELRPATGSATSFLVYNTHADNRSQLARERGIALILSRITAAAGTPTVLMGDFNAAADNPALGAIPSAALVNTHPGNDGWTYHGFTGKNLEGKIDHIFATPDWRVAASAIVTDHAAGRYPSDHFPVAATLRID